MPAMDKKVIKYLIHHMVLPGKLPQSDDSKPRNEEAISSIVTQALNDLKDSLTLNHLPDLAEHVSAVIDSVANLQRSSDGQGHICEDQVHDMFHEIATSDQHQAISVPLEIKAQNAGIIVRKLDDTMIFEAFELLPPNDEVMKTSGRLIRTFPTHACQVPVRVFLQDGCIRMLSRTLAKMCIQEVAEFQPQMEKGGSSHAEVCNTAQPHLITGLIMTVLSALGSSVEPRCGIKKHTREDILCGSTFLPWKRSPLWLLTRVAMQLGFNHAGPYREQANRLYKVAMIHVLANLLCLTTESSHMIEIELVHNISAKIIQRLRKLKNGKDSALYDICSEYTRPCLENARSRMTAFREEAFESIDISVDVDAVSRLQPADDLIFNVPELETFIDILRARRKRPAASSFEPNKKFPSFSDNVLPKSFVSTGDYRYFRLVAVEQWVEDNLTTWTERHLADGTEKLARLIKSYHKAAIQEYLDPYNCPVSCSVMYLTLMELWIALDKCAVHKLPLLSEYSPEIDVTLFQALSLPFRSQLQRLSAIEKYIALRESHVAPETPSIFRDFGHEHSFPVRQFNRSKDHETLKRRIEEQATEERVLKRKELETKKAEHQRLTKEAEKYDCHKDVTTGDDGQALEHFSTCRKCEVLNIAARLAIEVHEWPLPSNHHKAKAMVFEADPPGTFSDWRDLTMLLRTRVMGGYQTAKPKHKQTRYYLEHQEALAKLHNIPNDQRISLVSVVKPMAKSHVKLKSGIDMISENDIHVDNALDYGYFDDEKLVFTSVLKTSEQIQTHCTYRLSSRSSTLQKYLRDGNMTERFTPNAVYATLSDCPVHASVSEYAAFCTLPMGNTCRYFTILHRLSMPSIDFSKPESQSLILHTILQAGPPSDDGSTERVIHSALRDSIFTQALISQMKESLSRVGKNWESWRILAILAQLGLRILEFSDHDAQVSALCLDFLDKIRSKAFGWLKVIEERLQEALNDSEHSELCSRIMDVALVCISTFDVDRKHLKKVLSKVYFKCSITIRKYQNTSYTDDSFLYHCQLQSWRRVCFRASTALTDALLKAEFQEGLNEAIDDLWPDFRPNSKWQALPNPHHQWFKVQSGESEVLYNILTAEVILDNSPLTRLPEEYTNHPVYAALFPPMPIEAAPSDEPGMKYSLSHFHHDSPIHLGIKERDSNLALVTNHIGRKFDLVPSKVFEGLIPLSLINNYYHWYDHDRKQVSLRPKDDPWPSTEEMWTLKKVESKWQLAKGHTWLVNPASNTAEVVTEIFKRLDEDIYISFDHNTSEVSVEIPRAHLKFNFQTGQSMIYCKQYSDMVIDHDQRIGTLHGLKNRVALKHCQNPGYRILLISEASINQSATPIVHTYRVDSTLGRLVDNGSLHSKLFLCYLHALTSYCLPDRLTGLTGTENALSILRSAAVCSFDKITEQTMEVLHLIDNLTPCQTFYPPGKTLMQRISWDSTLPYMSQDPQLHLEVQKILDIAKQQAFFIKDDYVDPEKLVSSNPYLLSRHVIRTSMFRVDGFGAEKYQLETDRVYSARPKLDPKRMNLSFVASSLIYRDDVALHEKTNYEELERLVRQYFAKAVEVDWRATKLHPSDLKFSSKLLEGPKSVIPELWLDLHLSFTRNKTDYNKFDVMMWLATLAFAKSAEKHVIQVLASFYILPDMNSVELPPSTVFRLEYGETSRDSIANIVESMKKPLDECPEKETITQNLGEETKFFKSRRTKKWKTNQRKVVEKVTEYLFTQQQQTKPPNSVLVDYPEAKNYVRFDEATMLRITELFRYWSENDIIYKHIGDIATKLGHAKVVELQIPHRVSNTPIAPEMTCVRSRCYERQDIFQLRVPLPLKTSSAPKWPGMLSSYSFLNAQDPAAYQLLERLCDFLDTHAHDPSQKRYVSELRASKESLMMHEASLRGRQEKPIEDSSEDVLMEDSLEDILSGYVGMIKLYLQSLNEMLEELVCSADPFANLVFQLPRTGPMFWLGQLNLDNFNELSTDWKDVLIKFGLVVTDLNRATRLLTMIRTRQNPEALAEELRNIPHQNWNPFENPEQLLFEAESGITVRANQEQIAKLMRRHKQNFVTQLNMGEGKSSVIIPNLAAALSDGRTFARVVVGKSQFLQMRQTLTASLGGSLNRRIYELPFSRTLKPTVSDAEDILKICRSCKESRGILLTHPENILSFKLMIVESIISGQVELAECLHQTQKFMDAYSRDVVDESDDNLDVRNEVVYTMGTPKGIEMGAERWGCIQKVLSLVPECTSEVKKKFPSSIEIDDNLEGAFPRVRLLSDDAENLLLDLLTEMVCEKSPYLLGVSISQQVQNDQDALTKFIRTPKLKLQEVDIVENGGLWLSCANTLDIIRGLIAGDANHKPKTRLAVPYRSKDNPSARSEFSHPDVAIIFTQLSYYYSGLSDEDLVEAFTHLLKSDHADFEYEAWVRCVGMEALPRQFRRLHGVNLRDRYECTRKLFPRLRYNKATIDYFLGNIVFAKEMREFPNKLSASGWDLAAKKKHPTTGFSGTNDSRHILPLSIEHVDSEKHTDALALTRLLQDENTWELVPPRPAKYSSDSVHLLHHVNGMRPETRVILDVGAQILDLNNQELAETWLTISDKTKTKAIVYFQDEEIVVRDRDERVEPLQTSTYRHDLSDCLVYLDEAHTRGTDLKLPHTYRAAVFLGAHLSKDRLLQACMRLRKLGMGQSVALCINAEIQNMIIKQTSKTSVTDINVSDVVAWAIFETWADLRRNMPVWATQGYRFQRQQRLCNDNGTLMNTEQANRFQENESITVRDRYHPHKAESLLDASQIYDTSDPSSKIWQRCQDFRARITDFTGLGEQQERELNPEAEAEEERQLEKLDNLNFVEHRVSDDIQQLVKTSKMPVNSKDLIPAFQALRWTSIAQFDLRQLPTSLLVSGDFIRTIDMPLDKAATFDLYLKPVQWLLSIKEKNKEYRTLIVISAYEAEELLPQVRKSDTALLHLYAPRTSLSYASIDQLNLYYIGKANFSPTHIDMSDTLQLNLFAGQLYLKDYEEYTTLCKYLGLASRAGQASQAQADGFMKKNRSPWKLKESPVELLLLLLKIRRPGEALEKMHLGKMLQRGALLERDEFE